MNLEKWSWGERQDLEDANFDKKKKADHSWVSIAFHFCWFFFQCWFVYQLFLAFGVQCFAVCYTFSTWHSNVLEISLWRELGKARSKEVGSLVEWCFRGSDFHTPVFSVRTPFVSIDWVSFDSFNQRARKKGTNCRRRKVECGNHFPFFSYCFHFDCMNWMKHRIEWLLTFCVTCWCVDHLYMPFDA